MRDEPHRLDAIHSAIQYYIYEHTLSRLNRFRRLKIRYAHRADIHLAFLQPGCARISVGFLGELVLVDIQLVRTVTLDRRALPLLN